MPSIFSKARSRTLSTPQKKAGTRTAPLDEFGILRSGAGTPTSSRKQKEKQLRGKTIGGAPSSAYFEEDVYQVPDGTFLTFHNGKTSRQPVATQEPTSSFADPVPVHTVSRPDYSYLAIERHVVLSLVDCARLVDVLAEELGSRGGLATPFLFSSAALDINMNAMKRLIHAFIVSCEDSAKEAQWLEEARFTGMHELAMCLRWGLARVIRIIGGREVRGFFEWDHYNLWREQEIINNYPPNHFTAFLPALPREVQGILLTTMSLLTRLTAHSSSSGHTPPSLSPLFGPLFFGLGSSSMFGDAYERYLAATNATEHLLLAFIRWQDRSENGGTMGVPTKLKQWIKGYPAMLPSQIQSFSTGPIKDARKGARTVRVLSVRRNARIYSPDLVKGGSSWARRGNALYGSKEWERVAPPTLKLPPKYTESYRKKMTMPAGFHPQAEAVRTSVGYGASMSPSSSQRSDRSDYFSGTKEEQDRFKSLTDMKWGEFENLGFGGLGEDEETKNKLKFDLNETARSQRTQKRETLSWNDFTSDGFSRSDAPLSATLQFERPLNTTINNFSDMNVEMNKKLKKVQKSAPPFGWDTEPVIGSEEVIEEAFIDVFCDLIYGSGWLEDNFGLGSDVTDERWLERECNWALVEYKSLAPNTRSVSGGATDPRTGASLILFEEFVPLEYREQLASQAAVPRKRLPSLFSTGSSSKSKWKPAATLNGRPYVIGHVPSPRSAQERNMKEKEFEGMLNGRHDTRVLSLGSAPKPEANATPRPGVSTNNNLLPVRTVSNGSTVSENKNSPSKTKSGILSPLKSKKSNAPPAEYSTVDFETRLASYSDEENGTGSRKYEEEHEKQKRRESKDDAWVDILVGSAARRMGNQDAQLRYRDPEAVSLEVAQALAGVPRDGSISPLSHEPPVSDVTHGEDQTEEDHDDEDVDEIERVPRSAEQSYAESDADAETDDEEVEDALESIRTQTPKRPSYFDLHPDRKRPTSDYDDSTSPDEQRGMIDLTTGLHSPGPTTPPTQGGGSSPAGRTAALIEMYRERERASATTGSPSKLSPMPPASPAPAPAAPSPRKPAPQNLDMDIAPPIRIQEDHGRESPGRYIHGAPLHNVLEEAEEE